MGTGLSAPKKKDLARIAVTFAASHGLAVTKERCMREKRKVLANARPIRGRAVTTSRAASDLTLALTGAFLFGLWLSLLVQLVCLDAAHAQASPAPFQKLQVRPVLRPLPRVNLQCNGKVCLAAGGTAEDPHGSPTVCVADDDPVYGCGTCTPCILFQVEGPFCGPRGCDFQRCKTGWADRDGNRANGCEHQQSASLTTRVGSSAAVTTPRSCSTRGSCAEGEECIQGRCALPSCTNDRQCDDGLFCNGSERCEPGRSGVDARGCKAQPAVQCGPYQLCDENENSCKLADRKIADRDGDGSIAIWAGGDDCDDFDGKRAPGLVEVCDDQGHDEDCDPKTFGARDRDRDGVSDGACCNHEGEARYCGEDCDDTQAAVRLSSILCDGDKPLMCTLRESASLGHYSELEATSCPNGRRCVMQPNGVGICH